MEVSALTHAGVAGHARSPLLRLQSDERLITLIRRGNHHAFEALVARYQARLLAFCRHMLSSREDAEDVLQEVFAAAFNAINADEREINVRPWLYRIARNRSLNHLRKTQAIGVDSMDVHLSEHGLTTADKVHKREEFRQLMADVQDLPETQRTALLLREIDALSYDQIAEAMETTVPSVKSLLVRARVGLAEAAEARLLTCEEVRDELGEVAEGLRRTSPPVRRHLRTCDRCQLFKRQLRQTNRALAAVFPIGPLLLLKKVLLAHAGGAAASSGGAAAAGGSAAAAGAAARRRDERRRRRPRVQGRRRARRRGDRHRGRRRGQARQGPPGDQGRRRPERPGRPAARGRARRSEPVAGRLGAAARRRAPAPAATKAPAKHKAAEKPRAAAPRRRRPPRRRPRRRRSRPRRPSPRRRPRPPPARRRTSSSTRATPWSCRTTRAAGQPPTPVGSGPQLPAAPTPVPSLPPPPPRRRRRPAPAPTPRPTPRARRPRPPRRRTRADGPRRSVAACSRRQARHTAAPPPPTADRRRLAPRSP